MTIESELEDWARGSMPIYDFMGLKVLSVSEGLYKCFVPLTASTGNHIKTVHGVFQWASAEVVGGLAVISTRKNDKYVPIAKSLNINFKQPAFTDITAEALFSSKQAEAMNVALESAGRYDFELTSVIRDSEGEVVAEALGHYAVRELGGSDLLERKIVGSECFQGVHGLIR
jgi:acyl-coenzyme A thioesterase PaaI-like protein